jgi:hypothetical protein
MFRTASVLAFAAAVLVGGAARASDPIGGYLIVDRVVLEPKDSPTTIQIWGSFVLATGKGGYSYGDPQRGYLYYKAPAGKVAVCRKEWKDLGKVAGTRQVIGFGSSYDLTGLGKVRDGDKKPQSPDVYPLGDGLVKVRADTDYSPIRNLVELPTPLTPAEGDLVPTGEVTLVARNIDDSRRPGVKYRFELETASGVKEEGTVEAGTKKTRWTPKMKLKPGEKYTWRVRATLGKWTGPVASSRFVVKGKS